MGTLYALAGSFRQQWKVSLSSQQHLDWLVGILPQIFIVLWMAGQSDDGRCSTMLRWAPCSGCFGP